MSTCAEIESFLIAIHDYFRPRTLCITVARQKPNKRPEICYSTAFIMFFGKLPVLVTAGHTCQAIQKWKDDGTLVWLELNYAKSKFNDERFPLDANNLDMFWWDSRDDLDIGFLMLPLEVFARFRAFGISPVNRDAVSRPSESENKVRVAVGFSADGCKEADEIAFYALSNGKEIPIMKTDVGSLGRRILVMKGFTERRNSQFVGLPIRECESSVVGLSGALVLEFDGGKALRDYRIVGIQSGQRSIEKDGGSEAKAFYVNDAHLAVQEIERVLSEQKPSEETQ